MLDRQIFAVIVAGGSGTRIGGSLPKQFLEVLGKPIIVYAIEAFIKAIPQIEIVVAVNPDCLNIWEEIRIKHFPSAKIKSVSGGEQRFHSVKKALDILPASSNALVAVHDAVRPVLSDTLIKRCYKAALCSNACIPVIPMRASIRKKFGDKTIRQDRKDFVSVQTPQVFNLKQLQEAYQQNYQSSFTDDASVYEQAGKEIVTVEGEVTNLKVTYKEDLEIVATLLANKT